MIQEIKCNTCQAVIGTVEKPEVTEEDAALYAQMTTCPNGHISVTLTPVEQGDPE